MEHQEAFNKLGLSTDSVSQLENMDDCGAGIF